MKKRIGIIVTNAITVNAFLLNHINVLKNKYQIDIICKDTNYIKLNSDINKIEVNMERKINLFKDIKSFFSLLKIIKINNYYLTISLTPKAGLLCAIASKLINIEKRVHYFTGQLWSNKKYFKKFFFKNIDKIISILSTNILIDSNSQRNFLINNSVVNHRKSKVLGNGSISGVDIKKFQYNDTDFYKIRNELNISKNDFVVAFIGRMNADKGVIDLINTINELNNNYCDIVLLLIGNIEKDISKKIYKLIKSNNIKLKAHTDYPEKYINASNVLCLPSYREGFGNIVIEAASCGVPSLVSNIYGLRDSFVENNTGFVFDINNKETLKQKIIFCYKNRDKLSKLSKNCREFVYNNFRNDYVSNNLLNYLDKI